MTDRNYGAVRDAEKAIAFIDKLTNDPKYAGLPIAFDIEAGYTGPDKEGVALQQFHPDYIVVGISFTVDTSWARYIPFAHDDGNNIDRLPDVLRALWRMLSTGRGVAHNAAYELKGMARLFREVLWNDEEVGEEIRATKGFFPLLSDTMLLVWLDASYDPLRIGKDLKSVSLSAFGLAMTKFQELFPSEDSDLGPATKRGKTRFVRFNTRNSMSPKIIAYACEDSVAALMVHQKHFDTWADKFIFKTEMGLLPVLCEMEQGPVDENGHALGNMLFNWGMVASKAEEIARFRDAFNDEILMDLSQRLDRPVNINLGSVQQLAKVLFSEAPEGLGLPVKVRSEKTDNPSTSDEALRVIAKSDPIIKKILTYRQVVKLYGSYLNKFLTELQYSGTGVVFPNHNQAGALTGRMSVDQVSYQQWPKPYHFELANGTVFELNFRDLLIAPKGYRIIGYDFSQVELRVLAGQSNERAMLKAFADDVDIHKATAATMLRRPLEDIDKKQRGIGKTCNFAVVYGSGPGNIADMLTSQGSPTTKEEAEEMLEQYYAGFPNLRNWMDEKIAHGREQKYVETLFGRKFTVWEYFDSRDWIRAKGDRMCVNAPIQGGAADYMKIGMVRAQAAIKKAEREGRIPEDSIRLFMTVHDALEFYVRDDVETQTVIDLITPCVSFPVKGLPEIKTDWHEGLSWGHVVEIILDRKTKQISGYSWEDPKGAGHDFNTLQEAYAFQEAFEKGSAQPEKPKEAAPQYKSGPTLMVEVKESDDRPMALDPGFADDLHTFTPWDEGVEDGPEFCKACGNHKDSPLHRLSGDAPWVTKAMREAETTIVVTITEMPTQQQWDEFQEFVGKHLGHSPLRLDTPEGSITFDTKHTLTEQHQGSISIILGGAALAFERDAAGLDLEVAL